MKTRLRFRLLWLFTMLALSSLIATLVFRVTPHADKWFSMEYGFPAAEFWRTHRLHSTFLPIGFPFWLGLFQTLRPGTTGIFLANLTLYLGWLTALWFLFEEFRLETLTVFTLCVLFACYPEIVLSLGSPSHNALTAFLLTAFVATAIKIIREPRSIPLYVVLTLISTFGLLSRPNLIIFIPIVFITQKVFRTSYSRRGMVLAVVLTGFLYCAVTVLVHGKPFWPRMGAYNLFAGANPYTAADMDRDYDNAAEGSIIPALAATGVPAYHNWGEAGDLGNENEIRNPKFTNLYTTRALQFIRQHPGEMLRLTEKKTLAFFRPDLKQHSARSGGGLVKIAEASFFWCWLLAAWFSRKWMDRRITLIFGLTISCFAAPHILIISGPHYRVPMDILCLAYTLAVLIVAFVKRSSAKDLGLSTA